MKFKRKKVVKYRGSKTHGGGSMKKRRGAGNRGGRGNAGSGKRGDANKQTFQKMGIIPGKHGFASKAAKKDPSINLRDIMKTLPAWQEQGKVGKTEPFLVDLTKMRFSKLLGAGNIVGKFEIIVPAASPRAVEKVTKLGGKVKLPGVDEPQTTEEQP